MGLKKWFRGWKNRRTTPVSNRKSLAREKRQRLLFERLEDRLAPATTTVISGPTGIQIIVPSTNTAVVNLAGSNYTVMDANGITALGPGGSLGGVITNNAGTSQTFTTTDVVGGQTSFVVNDSVAGDTGSVQLFNGNPNIIQSVATVTINQGTLDLNGDNDAIDALVGVAGTTVTNTAGGSTATLQLLSNDDVSGEFDGVIADSGTGVVALTIASGSTGQFETLTGTNTYSGTTTLLAPTLSQPSILNIGIGGATGSLGTGPVIDNGNLFIDVSGTNTAGNAISGSGQIIQQDGTLILTNANNTYSGGTQILNGSTLQIGSGAGAGGLNGSIGTGQVDDEGSLNFDPHTTLTVPATITTLANTGNVAQISSGAGTSVILGGGTSWNGATTVNAGTLQFGNGSNSPTSTLSTSGILLNASSAVVGFDLTNNIAVPVNITGTGGLAQSGTGTVFLTGTNNNYSGGTNIRSGTVQVGTGGSGSIGQGNVTGLAAGALTFDVGSDLAFGFPITTIGSVTQEGNDTVTFDATAVNTYVNTIIGPGSTLQIGTNGSQGSLGTGGTPTVTDNGTLIFFRSDALTVSIPISGTGTVIQNGDGTTTLTGTNTYTGITTVNNGTLFINGSITSNVFVEGGTLGGTGTITGTVQDDNGTLQPGTASPAILNTGSLNLAGGTYSAVIGGASAGTGYNQDNVTGAGSTININGAALNIGAANGFVPGPSQQYTIISNGGTAGITGSLFNGLGEGSLLSSSFLSSGRAAYLTYQGGPGGNSVVIIVAGPVSATGSNLIVKQTAGQDLQVFNGATLLLSQPIGSVTQLNLNGVNGTANSVTFDFTGGQIPISGGITYTGGTGAGSSNSLSIVGGNFTTDTYTYTSLHDGSIQLDSQLITYKNLTPISNTGTAANIVFNLPATNTNASLQDDGIAGNGLSQLASTNSTFETTTFNDPTSSLTVQASGGTTNSITTAALPDFNAALTINGNSTTDTVTVGSAMTLGAAGGNSGNVTVTAHTINVNGTIDTTQGLIGNVSLTAGGAINLAAGISTSFSTVTLAAGGGVSQTAGAVTASDLLLTGAGTFSLLQAGNQSGNIAADVNGALSYADSGSPSIGSVGLTNGVNTHGHNLILNTGGTLSLGQDVTAAGATTTLNATTGGVNQFSGTLTTANLLLTGAGTFLLNDSNSISTAAAAVNGGISLTDAGALTVGTVGATNGITTNNNPLTVTAGGSLMLNQAINVGMSTAELQSNTNAITDGNGTNTEITAANLSLEANTGIGTLLAPVVTQISNLVASNVTGGIFVNNAGPLNIGFSGDPFTSVSDVVGNIVLNNTGSVTITTTNEAVATDNGTITIDAAGSSSDIVVGGGQPAIVTLSSGNDITLQAGRNLVFGTGGTFGNVESGGSIALTATSGSITLDEGTRVEIFGTGSIAANANGSINLLQTTTAGAAFLTEGGTITLTCKSFNAQSNAINAAFGTGDVDATQSGGNGNITINADSVTLADVESLNAGTGIVTIAPVTAGRTINLGTLVGGQLALTDAELGNVSTSNVLRIGDAAAGNIQVTAPIGATSASYNSTLSLITAGTITQVAGITETNLQAESGNGVTLTNAGNAISQVAGSTNGHAFSFTDQSNLTVGTVDTVNGITTSNGAVAVVVNTAGNSLTVSQPINAGNANVSLTADVMSVAAAVQAGANIVTLDVFSGTQAINLESTVGGTLSLLQADLNEIIAGILRIGSISDSAGLTVSGQIAAPAGWSTLDLANGGGIIDNNSTEPDITVTNLALQSQNGINLDTAVSQLDFSNSVNGSVNIRNTGGLTVTTVDGVTGTGNSAASGATFLSAASPIEFAVTTSSSGTLTATATETASEVGSLPEDNITVDSGVTVSSTSGDVDFTAGDSIILQSGSTVSAVGSVNLIAGSGDTDNDASMTLNGNITAPDITSSSVGNLVIGTMSASGTISLTAGGSITEGTPDPVGVDITATSLSLVAGTGIGGSTGVGVAPDGELETHVTNLAAQTNTGGIFIANTGDVNIGYATEPLPNEGLQTLTSGDIVLTSTGRVFVNNAGDVVSGQGQVTITAAGDVQANQFSSGTIISGTGDVTIMSGMNVVTGGGSTTAIGSGGNVTITATGNIFAGGDNTPTTFGAGPITSFGGSIDLTATNGDIVVDGDTLVEVTSGAGGITADAGGNITMQDSGLIGPQFSSQGGPISLTTGPGMTFTAITGIISTDALFSNGGNISITADNMSFGAGIDAGSSANVTLDTVTKSRSINLGSVIAGDLNLQGTDLNEVTAGALRIGNFATDTGNLTLSAAISAPSATPGTWSVLDLANAGTVTDNGGTGSLTVGNLALQGAGGVSFTNSLNAVAALAGKTTNQNFSFVNSADLTVGMVDGVSGIQAGSGSVSVTALTGTLAISQPVAGSGAPIGIALNADAMTFNAGVNGGAGIVALDTVTKTIGINLGTTIGGDLNLLQTDLNQVTAGVLRIGNFATDTGGLTVSAAITAPAGWNVLDLVNAGSVTDSGGAGSLSVGSLSLQGAGGVSFTNTANSVMTLAGVTTDQGFAFVNAGDLTVGTVDLMSGISTGSGSIALALGASHALTVAQPISGNTITFTADAANIDANVNGGSGFVIFQRVTGTEPITVGTKPGGTLGLTQADLNNISTTLALVIGDFFTAPGNLTVTAPITDVGTGWTTLGLSTGGTLTQTPGSTLTVASLNAFGGNGVTLTEAGNNVGHLTGGTFSSSSVTFVDSANLTVGGIPSLFPNELVSEGGAISVTLAPGRSLTVDTSIDTTNSGLDPAGANVTLIADNMTLSSTITGGTGGMVTLTTASAGQIINLGGSNSGTQLGLTDVELANISGAGLVIGDITNNTGGIVVSAAGIGSASAAGYNNTLTLETLGTVGETSGSSLVVPTLKVIGGAGVTLTNAGNTVGTLTGGTVNSGAGFSFTDSSSLIVGGPAGILTDLGPITLAVPAGHGLTVNGGVSTTNGGGNPAGANISLAADAMTFNAAIDGGTNGTVTLAAVGQGIDLGADSGSGRLVLAVPTASLSEVSADVLRIETNSGSLFIQGNVVAPATVSTLSLIAGNQYGIVESSGAITAGALALRAIAGIGNSSALLVNGPVNLAFSNAPIGNANSAGNVQITSTGGMTITSEDGLAASGNGPAGGMIILQAHSPITFAMNTSSPGDIDATTFETVGPEAGPEDDITVNSGVTVESTGGSVNFTSGDSIIIQSGSTVKSDTGTVSLQAGVGDTDTDATLIINGTISAPSLTINTPGDFLVTSLNVSGTLSITAGGSILDSDSGASALDITATSLVLSAGTGIGGSGTDGLGHSDPELETQVSNLGATTVSGGINISNIGTLNIGFGGLGVTDTGASGDITLTNTGSVSVITSGEVVSAPGNVSITANGVSDIITGGNNTPAISSSSSGTVTLKAGRDLQLGGPANNNAGDVAAFGGGAATISLTAGRDIAIQGGTAVIVPAGGAGISASAGRNLTISGTGGGFGHSIIITANVDAAPIVLSTGPTTGPNTGVFTANVPGDAVQSGSANISISADDMAINGGIDGGIGIVTLQQATTTTRNITIGGGASGLGLSDAELGRVTASTLRIGRLDNTGSITVDGNVTAHAGYGTLDLRSGGAITQGIGTVTVTNLALQASSVAMDVLGSPNNVTNLAANVTSAAGLDYRNNSDLNVTGPIDGVSGITSSGGPIIVGAQGAGAHLAVNSPISATNASISLFFDLMDFSAAVDAGSAGADLDTGFETFNRTIDIGTKTAGDLGLTQSDLNQVTAGVLQIGDTGFDTGGITVSQPIAAPATWSTLSLQQLSGAITEGASGSLQVTNLALQAAGMSLPNGNQVSNLAFNNSGGAVAFNNVGSLTITSVDGINTSTNTGTTTTLMAASPMTFAVSTSSALTLTATAMQSAGKTGDDISVDSGVTVQSTGGDVDLNAAGNVNLEATSVVQSAVAGTVNITAGAAVPAADTGALTLSLAGTITGQTVNLIDNAGPITTNSLTGIINATNLSLFATTGVGTVANPITTSVSALVAQTATGGIFVTNTGALAVGYAGEPFAGVTVTGASGDITLQAASMVLNDSVAASAGTIILNATSAGIDQVGGAVTGQNLLLTGSGTFTLNQAGNSVGTLAASITPNGSLSYTNSGGLTIGTVNATNGITSPGDVNVTVGTTLTVSQAVTSSAGSVTFTQNGAGGQVDIEATVSGSSVTVNGSANNDSLLLDFANGAALPNGLTYNGNGGTNALTVSDAGTASAHTYTITPTTVVRDGTTINYSSVQNLTVNGSDRGDSFAVTASPTTTIQINDGPTSAPGIDSLTVKGPGTITVTPSPTPGNGTVTVSGDQPINYVSIESLNISSADLVVDGIPDAPDTLDLFATTTSQVLRPAHDSGFYVLDGGPQVNFDNLNSFTFNSFGGGDTFNVHNPTSGPDTLFAPANSPANALAGVVFNAGGGGALNIIGGSETSAVYNYNARTLGGNSGSIDMVGHAGLAALPASYVYTGLAPLTNNGTVNDVTFNLPNGPVDNQALLASGGPGSTVLSSLPGGNNNFESTTIADPSNSLTIQDGSGAQTITLEALDSTFNAAINVKGGTGPTTFNVQATPLGTTPVGTTTTYTGGGSADVVNVGSLAPVVSGGTLAGIQGVLNLTNTGAGSNTVTVDDSGDAAAETAAILTDVAGFGQITGLGNPAAINYDLNTTGHLTVNGTSHGDTFTIVQSAPAAPSTTTIDTAAGGDVVNIRATSSGTAYTIQGQGGTDEVNIGSQAPSSTSGNLLGIQGSVLVTNSGPAVSAVKIDDSTDAVPRTTAVLDTTTSGALTVDRLLNLGNVGAIEWTVKDGLGNNETGAVTINAGPGGNDFLVQELASVGANAAGLAVNLNTGTGLDTVNIQATNAPLHVQGEGSADVINIGSNAPTTSGGNLAGIQGTVTIANSAGVSSITIDDSGDTLSKSATLDTFVDLALLQTFGELKNLGNPAIIAWNINDGNNHDGTGLVTINGGSGGNQIKVHESDLPAAGGSLAVVLNSGAGTDEVDVQATNSPLTIQGQGGNDVVNVGSLAPTVSGGTLADILGSITVQNQGASSSTFTTLTIDDSGDTTSRSATIGTINTLPSSTDTFGTLTGLDLPATAQIAWDLKDAGGNSEVQSVAVNGGSGGNTFTVNQTNAIAVSQSSFLFLNSGTGNDRVNVQAVPAAEVLVIQGQDGTDAVNVGSLAPATGGTLGSIKGDVFAYNESGASTVNIDDSGSAAATTYSLLDVPSVSFTSPVPFSSGPVVKFNSPTATVYWNSGGTGVAAVTINGASGGNLFNVNMTALSSTPYTVTLNTGTASDIVNIDATTQHTALVVQGQSGNDTVNLGAFSNTVQNISGTVNIENTGGSSIINVNDSADTQARAAMLTTFVPNPLDTEANSDAYGQISLLAPAPINYELHDTDGLTVIGDGLGNTFTVNQTAASPNAFTTTLETGTGADTVNVLATSSGVSYAIQGQAGNDQVNVGSLAPATSGGDLSGIGGSVTVRNQGASGTTFTTLTIDDSGDSTARSGTLATEVNTDTFGTLTGLGLPAGVSIAWDLNDAAGNSEVQSVTVNGGSGGNTINVNQTDPLSTNQLSFLFLNSGTGDDTVNVQAVPANGILVVQGQNGNDTVNVGSLAPATTGGTLANVNGGVFVYNESGKTALNIDDSGTTAATVYGLQDLGPLSFPSGVSFNTGPIVDFSNLSAPVPANIAWNSAGTGVAGVNIQGGSGGNSFGISMTAASSTAYTVTVDTGTAADTTDILATTLHTDLVIQGQSGNDTVNIGSGGSVQSILGTVNVENSGGATALTVDDSADTVARTVTLGEFSPNPSDTEQNTDEYGRIAGLAPADINYELDDTGSLTVNGGSPAGTGNTFNVDATGTGTTTLNAGSSGDTFNIKGSGLGAGSTDIFNGGIGNDTFNVSPSASATIQINGNLPTVAPGDTLTITGGTGVSINPTAGEGNGTVTFSNGDQSITYTSIETFNINSSSIKVQDTAETEVLNIYASNRDSGFYQFGPLGGGQPQINFKSLISFDFEGDNDGDTFNIFNPNPANPGIAPTGLDALFAPAGGVIFNAVAAADAGDVTAGGTLNISLGSESDDQYRYDLGKIVLQGTPTAHYTFSGLTLITNSDTGVKNVTLTLPTGDNQSVLESGGVSTTEFTSGAATFPTTFFTDPSSALTLNASDAGETVTLEALDAAFAAATIALNGGAGSDTFNIDATPAPTTTKIVGGGGNDTILLGSGLVAPLAGPVNLENPGGTMAVTVDDSAEVAPHNNIALTTLAPNPMDSETNNDPYGKITGLGAGSITYELNDTGSLILKGGNGFNVFNVDQTLAAVPGFITTIETGPHSDIVNVKATSAGITYNIRGGGGSNKIQVGLAGSVQGIQGTVNLENAGGANHITVDDSSDPTAQAVTLSSLPAPFAEDAEGDGDVYGQIAGLAPAVINYEYNDVQDSVSPAASGLVIKGGSGGNTFNVQDTGPNFTTQLETGSGNDTVNIGDTSNTLDGIAGALVVDGQTHNPALLAPPQTVACTGSITLNTIPVGDTINFNDKGSGVPASSYTLTPTSFGRTGGSVVIPVINFANMQTINVTTGNTAGPGTNVTIAGTPDASTTTINTTAGTGVVSVTGTGNGAVLILNLGAPANSITLQATGNNSITEVHGGAGANTMILQNTGTTAGVLLDGGTGTDTIDVEGAATGAIVEVTGTGTDTVNAGTTPLTPAVSTLDAIHANEVCVTATTFNINDHGSATAHTYTVNAGSVQRDSGPTLFENDSVQSLNVNCGSGGNTVSVLGTSAGTTTTLNTGAGNDTVSILATAGTLSVNGQGGTDTVSVTDAGSVQNISGTVNIENPTGSTTLTVDDHTDPTARIINLSTIVPQSSDSEQNLDAYGQIIGLAPAVINYEYNDINNALNPTASVTVLTGGPSGGTDVNVIDTGATTNIIAEGTTTITVGADPNLGAQGITGALTLTNSSGPDNSITVDDTADTTGQNVVLNTAGANGTITGMSPALITFANGSTSDLTLNGGSGGNTFTVTQTLVPTSINGGGNDTLIGPNQFDTFAINDINAGTMTPAASSPTNFPFPVKYNAIANLTGGSATDVFQFDEGALLTGNIDGGGGFNWLDYSAIVTTSIQVNLTDGIAAGVDGSVINVRNVIGSNIGGDTLIGSASGSILAAHHGGNTLIAGTGASILIGGYGRNLVVGGPGSDILINGRTTYDTNTAGTEQFPQLQKIYLEWTSGLSYSKRVHTLKRTALIYGKTVIPFPGIHGGIGPRFGRGGGQYDTTLIGRAGLDWFITKNPLDVLDPQKGEIITSAHNPDPAPALTVYAGHGGSLVVNLAGTDAGAAPSSVSGIATLYDAAHWTMSQPILKGVSFYYDPASQDLTVSWPRSYLGTFRVFLWDSQGNLFTSFVINAHDRAPIMSAVSTHTMSPGATSLTIKNIVAHDADGDPVTLTAAVTGYTNGSKWIATTTTPSGFDLVYDPVLHQLVITKPADFKGTFQITLTASDGMLSTQRTFKVKVS
jgi:hypothetical protein